MMHAAASDDGFESDEGTHGAHKTENPLPLSPTEAFESDAEQDDAVWTQWPVAKTGTDDGAADPKPFFSTEDGNPSQASSKRETWWGRRKRIGAYGTGFESSADDSDAIKSDSALQARKDREQTTGVSSPDSNRSGYWAADDFGGFLSFQIRLCGARVGALGAKRLIMVLGIAVVVLLAITVSVLVSAPDDQTGVQGKDVSQSKLLPTGRASETTDSGTTFTAGDQILRTTMVLLFHGDIGTKRSHEREDFYHAFAIDISSSLLVALDNVTVLCAYQGNSNKQCECPALFPEHARTPTSNPGTACDTTSGSMPTAVVFDVLCPSMQTAWSTAHRITQQANQRQVHAFSIHNIARQTQTKFVRFYCVVVRSYNTPPAHFQNANTTQHIERCVVHTTNTTQHIRCVHTTNVVAKFRC